MRSTIFACFSCLCLLTLQVVGKPAKNEFPIVIDGVKCSVKAYKAKAPIVLEPMVDKDFLPKSQVIIAIMLSHSDISSYMSNEEIFKFTGAKFDKEAAEQHRSRMKKMYEMTGPAAADNPWKGVKYSINQVFEVESKKGKFLVYQLMSHGGKDVGGELTSSLRNVAGKWSIGADESEVIEEFRLSLLKLVPAEFTKLHQASSIETLPFEDLLK